MACQLPLVNNSKSQEGEETRGVHEKKKLYDGGGRKGRVWGFVANRNASGPRKSTCKSGDFVSKLETSGNNKRQAVQNGDPSFYKETDRGGGVEGGIRPLSLRRAQLR